jgi:hypothetical protein
MRCVSSSTPWKEGRIDSRLNENGNGFQAHCQTREARLSASLSRFGNYPWRSLGHLCSFAHLPGDHPISPKEAAIWSIGSQGGKSYRHLRALFRGQKAALSVQVRCYISWTDRIDLDWRVT